MPENDEAGHDGTVGKGLTSGYSPMACDAERLLYVIDILSPSASYYLCSPERDGVDRFLYRCILHNPGVWNMARRHEYVPQNPSSVELCIDRVSSSSVPLDIKHHGPNATAQLEALNLALLGGNLDYPFHFAIHFFFFLFVS